MTTPIAFVDFQSEAREFGSLYEAAVKRVIQSGWYILGEEVRSFEKEFAEYLSVKHVIGVGNGLEALQIALLALGIGPRDEVITTPLSAVATTLAILAVGAKPIFVDTKEDGQLNEQLVESVINSHTKAILPVHLYGNACNLDELQEIASSHKLFLIEDAAQAHGASWDSQPLGTIGDFGCFSFYPTKNLGAIGDGGAIVTNNDVLAQKARQIRDYGQSAKYLHTTYGINSRLDELQAAILRVKLKHLAKQNKQRGINAAIYNQELDKSLAQLIQPTNKATPNYHQFVVRLPHRSVVQAKLQTDGIPSLVHYPTLIPDQPMFGTKYQRLDLPIARNLVKEILSLPCGPYLSSQQVKRVATRFNHHLFAQSRSKI